MKYQAYLCGNFSTENIKNIEVKSSWENQNINKESKLKDYSKYYYPDFLEFSFGPSKESGTSRFIKHFKYVVDKNISISKIRDGVASKFNLKIMDLNLYFAPYSIAIFSIGISMEETNPNNITAVTSILRAIRSDSNDISEFIKYAIEPIKTFSDLFILDDEQLLENGNKLKIFQIAHLSSTEWNATNTDVMLFELGTTAPIPSYNSSQLHSTSKDYFETIINKNRISVYNNWKALSLFDTFTMLGTELPQWLIKNWIDDYFSMIYINLLFSRFYLFRINNSFRAGVSDIILIQEQCEEFERKCSFNRISYNFLPEVIYESMKIGLELDKEKQQIYHMVTQEKNKREKKDNERMNSLLFFLTCVTMLSAVYDTSCLLNEMYPYDHYVGHSPYGFRIVTFLLLFILFFAVFSSFRKKRHND